MIFKKLKMEVAFQKHKRIIVILGIILIIFLACWGVIQINFNWLTENPALLGVMATLFGAVIGGTFTLLGSFWVNSRQQKAKNNIRKKNTIYRPLYDELIEMQNIILKENPYPPRISFRKDTQTQLRHPQFSAWLRIKNDARLLEVPDELKCQMENLEHSIDNYIVVRDQVESKIDEIFANVLEERGIENVSSKGIGSYIVKDLLSGNSDEIYGRAEEIFNFQKLDAAIRLDIIKIAYERCDINQIIINTREKFEEWLNTLKKTLDMLSLMIEQINLKYEG